MYYGCMTGNKTIDTILVGLLTLLSLATLGVFVYTETIYKRPATNDVAELKEMKKEESQKIAPEAFELEKMIINLNSQGSRLRFLEVEVHFVPFKPSTIELFNSHKSYIKDALIDITSNMAPDELNTVSGKVILEERIRRRLNDYFGKPVIKDIFFSRFVVQ